MAIGKWSMWVCGFLFLLIGLGALAVAAVPGVDDWVAEQTVAATGTSSAFDDEVVTAIADSEGVRSTSWILAGTFLPGALLFFWCGTWFRSPQPAFNPLVTAGTPVPTGPAPAPAWTGITSEPAVEPADPTAGGIIT
jgi:hypothetical protein